uniref:Cytochrome c oxidase subunit 5C n=1 Tax=Picea sitchensis TaxID=3332 RepID=A9NJT0_PICSI|nr:unknown [Picea sitchensis]ABK24962.1 unknown [Picea sitchensis]ABK25688.1 unknown [Picea sitchensis]
MAAHKVPSHVALKGGPSVIKEICYGLALGLMAGGVWKMYQWREQRKTREFYEMLERGVISVVHEEE